MAHSFPSSLVTLTQPPYAQLKVSPLFSDLCSLLLVHLLLHHLQGEHSLPERLRDSGPPVGSISSKGRWSPAGKGDNFSCEMESAIRPIHIRGATSEDHNRSRFMLRAAKQVPPELDKMLEFLNPENHDRLLRLDGNLFLSEAHTYLTTYYLWCSCCRKPEIKLTSILSIYPTKLDFLRSSPV